MADEIEGMDTGGQLEDSQDSNLEPQEGISDDYSQPSEGTQEKKDVFTDILRSEVEKAKGVESPFKDLEPYFAKEEMSAIKGLPTNVQNSVFSILSRVAEVSNKRVEEAEAMAGEYGQATAGMEEAIVSHGYKNTGDYVEHLVSFDKEMAANPVDALATLIFDKAGGSIDSLADFTEALEDAIYDLMDKYQYSLQDYGMQQSIQAAKEAKEYKNKYMGMASQEADYYSQAATQSYNNAVNMFASARDEFGRPAYPHFKAVRNLMGEIADYTGIDDLEELYYMACSQDPKIRKRLNNAPQNSLSLTNSPSGATSRKGGLPSLRDCFEEAKAERGLYNTY
jgi:hypothetical protein